MVGLTDDGGISVDRVCSNKHYHPHRHQVVSKSNVLMQGYLYVQQDNSTYHCAYYDYHYFWHRDVSEPLTT